MLRRGRCVERPARRDVRRDGVPVVRVFVGTLIALAAAAMGAEAVTQGAEREPNDHASQASILGSFAGTVSSTADHDWYALRVVAYGETSVAVTLTDEHCPALRATLLNPRGHPMRWVGVERAHPAELDLVRRWSDRYYVEVHADDPACAGASYTIAEREIAPPQGELIAVEFSATRCQFAQRRVARLTRRVRATRRALARSRSRLGRRRLSNRLFYLRELLVAARHNRGVRCAHPASAPPPATLHERR
jgi:hypothetical protein